MILKYTSMSKCGKNNQGKLKINKEGFSFQLIRFTIVNNYILL